MPKKRQQNQRGKQQRAMQKRTRRKTKLARRAVHESAADRPDRVLRRAREFPFAGCWVQPGWQDYGIASMVVARAQPSNEIVFARFLVDTFCLGMKDTFFGANVPEDQFHQGALPRLYAGVEPVPISVELAHEIVYGAIEYAEANGFRPHGHFRRTQWILDPPDVHPSTGAIRFGYRGRPTYLAGQEDNQSAILNKLVATLGRGGFTYIPAGDPPEGFEDLVDLPEDAPEQSLIWTPQQEDQTRSVASETGIWLPGQDDPESEWPEDEPAEEPSESQLWVPGR